MLPTGEQNKAFLDGFGEKIWLHILTHTETARCDRNALPEPSMTTIKKPFQISTVKIQGMTDFKAMLAYPTFKAYARIQ